MKAGWIIRSLGDVGKVSMCKRVLKKQTNTVGGIPFYKIGTFGKEPNAYIDEELYNEFREKYSFPKKGDILLSASGTIGRRVVYDGKPAYFQDSNIVWIDNDESEVLNEYLYKFYGHCKWNASKGATISRLYNDDLRRIQIPIPPLEEQKQIVAILDEAFAAIEQAQANIEKNIDNAKELFQSKLNEIFSQKGEGWKEKSLGEACIVERGSSPRPIKKYITESEDGVNWIKIGDVAENAKFVTHTKQKITKEGAEKSRYVGKGDFILSNSMSFGRPYIMKIDGYIHDGWFVLRLPEDIHSDYFWQLLSSSFVKNQINQLAAGAIVKNISGDLVKKVNLSIPPIEAQKTIASQCDSLSLVIKSVISTYETKLTNLEDLKQSLLEQAFAGKLTCNEPNPTH